jgi:hypothetical protein
MSEVTRQRIRDLLSTGVLNAWLEGQPWQWRVEEVSGSWGPWKSLKSNGQPCESPFEIGPFAQFRVKPRALELWVPEFAEGVYGSSRPERVTTASEPSVLRRWILMREVEPTEKP